MRRHAQLHSHSLKLHLCISLLMWLSFGTLSHFIGFQLKIQKKSLILSSTWVSLRRICLINYLSMKFVLCKDFKHENYFHLLKHTSSVLFPVVQMLACTFLIIIDSKVSGEMSTIYTIYSRKHYKRLKQIIDH